MMSRYPGNARLTFECGVALLETGAAAQAADALHTALHLAASAPGQGVDAGAARLALSRCYRALKQPALALETLQQVPDKARTGEMNKALAELSGELGLVSQAVASLKDVLRVQPLALDCLQQLLAYGVPKMELLAIVSAHKTVASELGWLDQVSLLAWTFFIYLFICQWCTSLYYSIFIYWHSG